MEEAEVEEAEAEEAEAAGVGPDKRPVYHLLVAARKDPDTGQLVDPYAIHRAPKSSPRGASPIRCTYSPAIFPARLVTERSGTPTTTSTSWRPWCGRTGGGCSRGTTSGARGRRLGRWRRSTDFR